MQGFKDIIGMALRIAPAVAAYRFLDVMPKGQASHVIRIVT
jgi:hypothetical protein